MKMKKKKTAAPKKSPRPKARPVDKSPRAEMAASPRDFAKKKKKK
jgi:hypothetical protein